LSFLGKHSIETKQLMAQKALGNQRALGYRHTLDAKVRIGFASGGRPCSEDVKLRLRIIFLGRCTDKEAYTRWLGSGNPSWNGGSSTDLYPCGFRSSVRQIILTRDHFTCQMCSSTYDLFPHHIDYDKSNVNPTNLITLCRSCNSVVNRNREFFTLVFSRIIQMKYRFKEVSS
jgi:hypothetical protein